MTTADQVRALAGRFILTTERHPHGTHLKIRSTKSSQMLVVVEEEIEPLANAMLNMAREEKQQTPILYTGNLDSIRKTIKAAREAKGWSVDDLAYEAGLSPKAIHSIEEGGADYPLEHIKRCMYALNLYVGWVVEALPGNPQPRYKVWSNRKFRTWEVAQAGKEAEDYQSFTTWQEAMEYANQKVEETHQ